MARREWTPAERAAISARLRGHTVSRETRAKLAAVQTGKRMSPESRAKQSAWHKGRVFSHEHRANMAAAQRGKSPSVETRAKIAATLRGVSPSADARAKISAKLKGRITTRETRSKLSRALTGKRLSPSHRSKLSDAHKGQLNSADARARQGASMKRAYAEGRIAPKEVPKSRRYTKLAQALHAYLSARGFIVEPEVRFGRFTVDLYDREHHIAHEADGQYWHAKNEAKRPGYHASRDTYLREHHGLPVLRYTDTEIRYLES